MESKVNGEYYLVECPGWNAAGFCVAQFNNYTWTDASTDSECTDFVKSYKSVNKVGKMRPYAVFRISKSDLEW
jgi:hypothetical protein